MFGIYIYMQEDKKEAEGEPRTGWRPYDQTTNSVGTTAGQYG